MNNMINLFAMLAAIACIASANIEYDHEDDTFLESDGNSLDYPMDNSIDDLISSDDNKDDEIPLADEDGIYYKVYPKKEATHNKKYPVTDEADDRYAAKDATRHDDVGDTAANSDDTTEDTSNVFLSFILSLFRFPILLFA